MATTATLEPGRPRTSEGLIRGRVKSADGTEVVAHWSPASDDGEARPTIVLAGDLAEAVPDVWRPQLDYLGRNDADLRFVTWAYRGTGSSAPGDRHDVAAHLEDLWAVLRGAGLSPDDPIVIVASGVGVRIAMEAALAHEERIRGLVLIGGAAGWRYRLLCRASWLAARLAASSEHKRHRAALVRAATHGVDRMMHLAEMSLVHRGSEPARTLRAVAASLNALGTERVVDQARRIEVPALVLCGERDPRMPAALAHQLARHLNRSRVLIVPRTTSRLAARLPDLVNLEIERFLTEVWAAWPRPERRLEG